MYALPDNTSVRFTWYNKCTLYLVTQGGVGDDPVGRASALLFVGWHGGLGEAVTWQFAYGFEGHVTLLAAPQARRLPAAHGNAVAMSVAVWNTRLPAVSHPIERPRFESASALLSFQKLWSVDTVL